MMPYKVLKPMTLIPDAGMSVFASGENVVIYRKDERATPPIRNSGLFYFNSLYDAIYYKGGSGLQIWECEVTDPRYIERIAKFNFDYKSFWDNQAVPDMRAVQGTHIASSITIKKLIKNGV